MVVLSQNIPFRQHYLSSEAAKLAALLIIGAVFICLPLWGVGSLGLSDYANHMARFHIIENLSGSDALQKNYVLQESPSVYWGMSLFMDVFGPLIGAEAASYAFTVLSLYVPFAGAVVLNRVVTGKVNILSILAILFVYSEIAGWGFTNYLLATGVSFFLMAAWIGTDAYDWKKRLGLFLVLFTLITLFHLIAAALLGFALGMWELARFASGQQTRNKTLGKLTLLGGAFVPSAYIILHHLGESVAGSGVSWAGLAYHINTAFSPIVFINGGWGSYLHLLPLAVIWASLRVWPDTSGGAPAYDRALLVVAMTIFCLGLVAPYTVNGIAYVGMRFPVFAAFILVASVQDRTVFRSKRLIGAVCFAIVFKLSLVHLHLAKLDNQIAELRAASSIIPMGSRVLPMTYDDSTAKVADPFNVYPNRYSNFMGYLIKDRDILMPFMFTQFEVGIHTDHQAYTVMQSYAPPTDDLQNYRLYPYLKNWQKNFDYVVLMDMEQAHTVPANTRLVHDGSWFDILQIEKRDF